MFRAFEFSLTSTGNKSRSRVTKLESSEDEERSMNARLVLRIIATDDAPPPSPSVRVNEKHAPG